MLITRRQFTNSCQPLRKPCTVASPLAKAINSLSQSMLKKDSEHSEAHTSSSSGGSKEEPKKVFIPMIAAGLANLPTFRSLMEKSNLQVGDKRRVSMKEGMREGIKACPSVAGAVGLQVWLQGDFKRLFPEPESVIANLGSSAMVAIISVLPLTIVGGRTRKFTAMGSIKRLNMGQVALLTWRETLFVFTTVLSNPVCEAARKMLGDSKFVTVPTSYLLGMAGSFGNHIADTAFTMMQNGVPFHKPLRASEWTLKDVKLLSAQLRRGALVRGHGLGMFNALYTFACDAMFNNL